MSFTHFRETVRQAKHSIDAFVMVGGTLLGDCADILSENNSKALRKRILFPSLNSPWLVAYLEDLHIPIAEYEYKILINSAQASLLGFEVRFHRHPVTAWYIVVDRKEVFQKQIGVLTTTYPEAVQLLEASKQFSLLFEIVWKSASIEATLPEDASGTTGSTLIEGHRDTANLHGVRVFLSHSSTDKPMVRDVYQRLLALGVNPWFDEIDLLPGQDFDYEIDRAVRQSDVIIVFLSGTSTRRSGYLQKELRYALDVAERQPEGKIFLIPALLEPCDIPRSLAHLNYVKLFEDSGFERLVAALKASLTKKDNN